MPSQTEKLRKFRSDIAALKKRGLISGVDARTAKPNRRLNAVLDKYDAVISGKASAVKLDKKGLAEYKALGKPYEIAAPRGLARRVIVPHEPGERVTVSHGKVTIHGQPGVTRTVLPVKYHNLEQYLNELAKSKQTLGKNEYFAFRFYGNRSHKIFRTMGALVNQLQHYESIFDAVEENNSEAMAELYQNLEIVKIDRPGEWATVPPTSRPYRRGDSGTSYATRKRKLARAPEYKREEARTANAQRQKDYRARLKRNPAKLEAYRAKARTRAKKNKK